MGSGSAIYGGHGIYRYLLTRSWDIALPTITWVMLNPSTATATENDPTLSRVVGFSRSWGYGGAEVVNLFAFRSPSPLSLRTVKDPVGPANDHFVAASVDRTRNVLAAWGNNGEMCDPMTGERRCDAIWRLFDGLGSGVMCLGMTKRGQPSHPLYRRGGARPSPIHSATRPGEDRWTSGSGTRATPTRSPRASSPIRSTRCIGSSRTPPRGSGTVQR